MTPLPDSSRNFQMTSNRLTKSFGAQNTHTSVRESTRILHGRLWERGREGEERGKQNQTTTAKRINIHFDTLCFNFISQFAFLFFFDIVLQKIRSRYGARSSMRQWIRTERQITKWAARKSNRETNERCWCILHKNRTFRRTQTQTRIQRHENGDGHEYDI